MFVDLFFLSLCGEISDIIKSHGCLRIIRLFMNLKRFSLSKFPLKNVLKGAMTPQYAPMGLSNFLKEIPTL